MNKMLIAAMVVLFGVSGCEKMDPAGAPEPAAPTTAGAPAEPAAVVDANPPPDTPKPDPT